MSVGQVRVAIIGTGDVGRGWAAMCVARGWPVALYDAEAHALENATTEIAARAQALTELGRAEPADLQQGLAQLVVGRSILEACRDAQWVIEAGPEDLKLKQRLFENIESVAGAARAVTSSASGLHPADIAALCVRQERCFVAHPQNPPELIPLVELVAAPLTDTTTVEVVKGWLHALGRIPVIIRKQVAGNVADRIAAAVWREAIDLVLSGVIDVEDLDRAVSVGPGLAWAAAGPHLTYHLAAGERGVTGFLQRLLQTYEEIWKDLPTWSQLDPDRQRKLTHAIEKAYAERMNVLRPARDRRLAGILKGMEEVRDK
jgi:3-hydroxypropionate dehydrogenase (NADP+)